jgi:hypothetical protein
MTFSCRATPARDVGGKRLICLKSFGRSTLQPRLGYVLERATIERGAIALSPPHAYPKDDPVLASC